MMANALSDTERALMDAYWRAANYLSVGQIYLYDNPLLKQSLTEEVGYNDIRVPLDNAKKEETVAGRD
jgi:phosphoketolase